MSISRSITVLAAAALLAIPSVAVAVGPPTDPGNGHKPAGTGGPTTDHTTPASTPTASDTPGPGAPPSVKGKAYGRYCADQSKKHVAGQKGTPFSQCVTAMAKAASGKAKTARAACAGMSHKHKAGTSGSPYSRCVAAASRLTDQPGPPASA